MPSWSRERTVLVMWEYAAEYSPLWSRSADLEIGQLDARDLDLEDALRDDLADWNRRCEAAADPNDVLERPTASAEDRARGAEAFALAARVQRGLGDRWVVWCLAGGGDGGLRGPGAFEHLRRSEGPQLVLRDSGLVDWTPTSAAPALDHVPLPQRREARAWLSTAERLPPAERRATALEVAGRIHGVLERGRVLWFGGGEVPG